MKIKELRAEKNLTIRQLSEKSGVSMRMISGYESGENDITLTKMQNIAKALDVSIPELIGEYQVNSKLEAPVLNEEAAEYSNETTTKALLIKGIPLYNVNSKFFNNSPFKVEVEPLGYISFPNAPYCDGAITVIGDGMSPRIKSGDIVMYKEIKDFINELFWGDIYLIEIRTKGTSTVIIKYILESEKGDDFVLLKSENPSYPPKDVHKSTLRSIAKIQGTIKWNAMG